MQTLCNDFANFKIRWDHPNTATWGISSFFTATEDTIYCVWPVNWSWQVKSQSLSDCCAYYLKLGGGIIESWLSAGRFQMEKADFLAVFENISCNFKRWHFAASFSFCAMVGVEKCSARLKDWNPEQVNLVKCFTHVFVKSECLHLANLPSTMKRFRQRKLRLYGDLSSSLRKEEKTEKLTWAVSYKKREKKRAE